MIFGIPMLDLLDVRTSSRISRSTDKKKRENSC
jgi:hypothetical protein